MMLRCYHQKDDISHIAELDIGDLSYWLIKSIVLLPAANGHSLFVLLPLFTLSPAAKPVMTMLPNCT
jgi:hypothetical protein